MIEHVVSLDEAKELAKVLPDGFKSKLYYERYRVQSLNKKWTEWSPSVLRRRYDCRGNNSYQEVKHYPAPIAEELLALLPETYQYTSCDYINDTVRFRLGKTVAGYFGDKHNHFGKRIYFNEENINLATALSKLYRWLHGQGYIKEGK